MPEYYVISHRVGEYAGLLFNVGHAPLHSDLASEDVGLSHQSREERTLSTPHFSNNSRERTLLKVNRNIIQAVYILRLIIFI